MQLFYNKFPGNSLQSQTKFSDGILAILLNATNSILKPEPRSSKVFLYVKFTTKFLLSQVREPAGIFL
jgi:hypothetical protein|tara:strand:+ start:347 stop:550 length:204 start_codon:yes stop_codon:yes gene_type:complete